MDHSSSTIVGGLWRLTRSRYCALVFTRATRKRLALALVCFLTASVDAAGPAQSVFQKASPSVVRVEVITSSGAQQGSAVAIRKSLSPVTGERSATWLVTNAHVVSSATRVVGLSGDRRFDITVEYSDPVLDIAFLLADADWIPIAEISTESPLVGTEVFAIGSPRGLTNTLSSGIVSGRREFSGLPALQMSASIAPGSSGGGLFDSTGKLLGITTARLGAPGEALNFALTIGSVRRLEDAYFASENVVVAFKNLFSNAEQEVAKAQSRVFIRWLASPAQDASRKYILDFNRETDPAAHSTEQGRASRVARLSEYQKRMDALMENYDRSQASAIAGDRQKPADPSAGEQVLLSCRFLGNPYTESNPLTLSFVIDLKRQAVNGKPATIDDRRIRQESGSQILVIDRISGVAAFTRINGDGPVITGPCTRVAEKAF